MFKVIGSFLTLSIFSLSEAVTLHEKIGQMIMIGFHGQDEKGTGITDNSLPNTWPTLVHDQLSKGMIGGIILFKYNISNADQLKKLIQYVTRDIHQIAFVGVDNEGGKVQRLNSSNGFSDCPSAAQIAQMPDQEVQVHYATMARMLADTGINFNFAPVVDINVDGKLCPVIGGLERSYGDNPEHVIKYARLMIEAMHQSKILCCLKHYLGYGGARDDSHEGYVDVTSTYQPQELVPYKVLNQEADAIMTAHVFNEKIDKDHIATFSPILLTTMLRNQLNFQKLIVSDDLHMGAVQAHYTLEETIIKAIQAGVDVLLFSNNPGAAKNIAAFRPDPNLPYKIHAIIRDAVKAGKIDPKLIDAAYERIIAAKKNLKS